MITTKKYLYILCISCLLLGCGQQASREVGAAGKTEPQRDPAKPAPAQVPLAAPVALNAYRETLDLSGYKDLGSFHFRRLHFYAKENPGITIGPAEVEHVTLYFIDRYLVKIRYRLSEDVSEFLADSLATQAGKQADAKKNWATNHQIRWRYFSKLITYQNRCPENDLANELTGGECDSGYWLYAELPGYRSKVNELESVAKYMVQYLIDDPPNKAEEE